MRAYASQKAFLVLPHRESIGPQRRTVQNCTVLELALWASSYRQRRNAGTAGIPVVFMTARVQRSEVAHLLSLGAAGVVAKPFDPLTLAKSVRACVACEAIPAAQA